MSSKVQLGNPIQLSPATPQVDALVFAAAPDTQALSVQGAKYPGLTLDDGGGTVYYEGTGRDYVIDYDADGYAISITTIAGGALDAGGGANATYRKAFFDADDVSEWFDSGDRGVRFTCDAGAGGPLTFETEGRVDENGTEYPLGTPEAMLAGVSFTRFIDEPNTQVRANLSALTGPVKLTVQEYK